MFVLKAYLFQHNFQLGEKKGANVYISRSSVYASPVALLACSVCYQEPWPQPSSQLQGRGCPLNSESPVLWVQAPAQGDREHLTPSSSPSCSEESQPFLVSRDVDIFVRGPLSCAYQLGFL